MNNSSRSTNHSNKVLSKVDTKLKLKNFCWVLLIPLSIAFKWFVSQDPSFNSKLLDDENEWFDELNGRKGFDYLFLRDIPGYFVIPLRLVLLSISKLEFPVEFSVRIFVTLTQVLCIWILTQTLFQKNMRLRILVFAALTLIPLEDLNYLHNVGYFFLLIFLSAWIKSSRLKERNQVMLALACGLLVVKTLVAMIMLASMLIDVLFFRRYKDGRWINPILSDLALGKQIWFIGDQINDFPLNNGNSKYFLIQEREVPLNSSIQPSSFEEISKLLIKCLQE